MSIDIETLYQILRQMAMTQDTITYDQLSDAYLTRAGVRVNRRAWGPSLLEVSNRLHYSHGLPPISSLVVSSTDGMPSSDGYWGIPGAPPYKDHGLWVTVCKAIYAHAWPATLPP